MRLRSKIKILLVQFGVWLAVKGGDDMTMEEIFESWPEETRQLWIDFYAYLYITGERTLDQIPAHIRTHVVAVLGLNPKTV